MSRALTPNSYEYDSVFEANNKWNFVQSGVATMCVNSLVRVIRQKIQVKGAAQLLINPADSNDQRAKPSCSRLFASSRRSAYTRHAPAPCNSAPSDPPVCRATAAAFIRRAARTSHMASPTMKQSSGSLSSLCAARRKRSGAGFAASTSSAVRMGQSGRFEMRARSRLA
jgi:hypothetical protein